MSERSETLRSDAARNRDALVNAARAVFSEQGLAAPLDEIARRAGVGNATLYRRFPTRQDLIKAVFVGQIEAFAQALEEGLQEPDPWKGFETYVLHLMSSQAADRGLADLMCSRLIDESGPLGEARTRALNSTVRLIERAKTAGALRADFYPQDLILLLMANSGLLRRTSEAAPDAWRRFATLFIDGLRAEAATRGPPALASQTILAAMQSNPELA